MAKEDKQMARLAALETELRSRLVTELEVVAAGRNSLFFVTPELNVHQLREHLLSKDSAELSDLASEALALAASLGAPEGAPVAGLFRRYLVRANDLTDHHRLGPARLARELLSELARTS